MSKLPQGWIECKVGDLINVKNGYAFKSTDYTNEGFPIIRISEINNLRIDLKNAVRIPKAKANYEFQVSNGDLLMALSGATTGKVGVYNGDEIVFQNQRVGNFKILDENVLINGYRNYFIISKRKEIELAAYGGAQPNISASELEELAFPLAPLNEQKQIVEKLDKLLARVEESKARLDKIPVIIKRFRQSVLNAAVTGELTKDWREKNGIKTDGTELIQQIFNQRMNKNKKLKFIHLQLNDFEPVKNWGRTYLQNVFDVETGGTPYRKEPSYWEKGNIPWIKSGQVQNTTITEAEEFITAKAVKETNVKIFPVNTILVAMYGEGKTRGQVGLLKIEATTNQACAALVNEELDNVIRDYVYIFCLSQYEQIRMISVGGNQPNLNLTKIKNWEINIPPFEEQKEIVKRVEALFKKADEIEERYKKAKAFVEKLTQSILAKAFRGELVPQNPNDEPAEKLLKRIREEREEREKGNGNRKKQKKKK